jgi:hypothetical protein
MNGSINTTSTCQLRVRRVHNGIDSLLCDVALSEFDATDSEVNPHDNGLRFCGTAAE